MFSKERTKLFIYLFNIKQETIYTQRIIVVFYTMLQVKIFKLFVLIHRQSN